MLATPAIRKTRLDDMNDKPILLVCTKEKLEDSEKWLQSKAEVFWEDEYITLSRLPLSVFHDSYSGWHKQVVNEIPNLQSFGEIATDTNISSIIFNGFEDGSAKNTFSGNASFYSRKGQQVLLDKKIDQQFKEGKYEVSFWLYVDSRKYDMPKAEVKVFDASGNQSFYKQMNTRQVHDTYNGWIRVSEIVELRPDDTLQLLIKDEYVSVDNLLVKPADAKVLVKTSTQNFYNNYPL